MSYRQQFHDNHSVKYRHLVDKSKAMAAGCLVCAFTLFAPLQADDTEVFFGKVDLNTNGYPNVLFVLDTSGSMNSFDAGHSGTRLERMKEAMTEILDESTNLNIGLMRFNGFYGGGSVVYPVTPIDKPICEADDCGIVNLSSRGLANNDDMEQFVSNGNMTPNGNILSLGSENGNKQLVGMRFQGVNIPAGASIISASIDFTAEDSHGEETNLTVVGHAADDSPSIGTNNYYLRDLPKTTASVDWSPESWHIGNLYTSPDLKSVVQEIVDRDGWCGGQALSFVVSGDGERRAYSYNNSPSRSPLLRIEYDSETIPSHKGCMEKTAVAQVQSNIDDAIEFNINGSIYSGSNNIEFPNVRYGNNYYRVLSRLRFQNLQIPNGAEIKSASISLKSNSSYSGSFGVDIKAEARDNALELSGSRNWISNQPTGSQDVRWNISSANDTWSDGVDVDSPDIARLVEEVVNRPGWELSNDIAFQISAASGTSFSSRRRFDSFDYSRTAAPKLKVVYRTDASGGAQNVRTAREDMKQVVSELSATGGTPIVAAYYEAVQYMLGGEVDYGKSRGTSYYRHRYHRVSHPDSYTGGNVVRHAACTDNDIENSNCSTEQIQGNPVYISPHANSCHPSHIVFLSDGAATSNTAASRVQGLTGEPSCDASGNQACGIELAHWLSNTDHVENRTGLQNINTYTVGFNINSNFLGEIAANGGGEYHDADSSAELVAVFQDILGEVLAVDTSFVAPGATVNQFNRLTHRNDIYFALFRPDRKPTWSGNLKRYHVGADEDGVIRIQDRQFKDAINEDTGFFKDTAKSWWGTGTDGSEVEKGGAAGNISLSGPGGSGDRNTYTLTGNIPANGADLTNSEYKLHEDNSLITESLLGITDGDAAERQEARAQMLKWIRGVDIKDSDADGNTTEVRQHLGDPMHARPVVLNYGEGTNTRTTIFMATNEGLLHAIENENGTELFAFMPEELIPNIKSYYDNLQATRHPYGLDGDISVWHDDANENVTVDNGEKAYLYVGMRRGGNLYYAFDVSDRTKPKLMWKIEGGAGDFAKLGQTWSKAVPTSIVHNGDKKKVLIFAGGYDTNQDPNSTNLDTAQDQDSIGNALYVVDAITGALIWSGQGDNSGNRQFSDMQYSIPANVRVIDINSDGLADQMYVGDMGGQVWRFDFTQYHKSGDALIDGGVIADLSGSGIKDARRFYNEPDVALIARNGRRYLSVSIGSGWRAHPLNENVDDRYYLLQQNSVYSKPAGYGKNVGTLANPSWTPLLESDLNNVSNDLDPDFNTNGWYLHLEGTGEKVLGDSITINNQVIFTTYEPSKVGDQCTPASGSGNIYVMDVESGAPTLNLDQSGDSDDSGDPDSDDYSGNNHKLTKEDRKRGLKQGGIPPSPTALITESGGTAGLPGQIGTTILVSTEQPVDVDFSNLTQRTYWQDKGRGNRTPDEIPVAENGD